MNSSGHCVARFHHKAGTSSAGFVCKASYLADIAIYIFLLLLKLFTSADHHGSDICSLHLSQAGSSGNSGLN